MFDWLRRKRQNKATSSGQGDSGAPQKRAPAATKAAKDAAKTEEGNPLPIGRWISMELPSEANERFLGYVYFDSEAGLSAKGGPEGAAQIVEFPTDTVRLPMPVPMELLTPEEISIRGLPPVPRWLEIYGPQPDPEAAWRRDPDLEGRFHASYPDDVQVLVHDGEPRRTGRLPELCWARILEAEQGPPRHFIFPQWATISESEFVRKYQTHQMVYMARLLNAPKSLESVHQGDTLRFIAGGGLKHPLQVTSQYLAERHNWGIAPCSKCGMGECFDPPSVMAKVRFPDAPPDQEVAAFTSRCALCRGSQLLERRT